MAWFFSHDAGARNSLGMIRAEKRWGSDAYAGFFKVQEVLCASTQTHHRLTWDDIDGLAEEFKIPKLREIVEFLSLPSSGLLTVDDRGIWCQEVMESVARMNAKAASGRKGAEARWAKAAEKSLADANALRPAIGKEGNMELRIEKEREEDRRHSVPFVRPELTREDLNLDDKGRPLGSVGGKTGGKR